MAQKSPENAYKWQRMSFSSHFSIPHRCFGVLPILYSCGGEGVLSLSTPWLCLCS